MDWYRTAAELYTSSLRALEQRSTAFLFTQSLLVGAFAILFANFLSSGKDVALFIPILGLTIVGLVFSLVYYVTHRIVSKDTAYWRAYMRWLETRINIKNNISKDWAPWHLSYTYAERREGKAPYSRGFAQKRLPGPLLWLFSPALFLIVWICALLWVIQTYSSSFSSLCFWIVSGILCAVVIATNIYRWVKATDNIYEELQELVERAETNNQPYR